ncbi:MAG TPA: HipA family kinase [Gemmatimonadaceae bacterium]|nr:HipA family kinase [Gemmatimonadaceae bacterium]
MPDTDLPRYDATRYLQPLREGGSLPAVVDTDGGGLFVAKFRGAGQGPKVLIAELIVGMLAAAAGLPMPELALIEIGPAFGRNEPDPEIQEILKKSHGVNVGLRYLDGAFNFDPSAAGELVSSELATRLVWLDAFVTNPDRTHRNPNLLVWQRKPWLIDHGAALYAHHDWPSVDAARARVPFPLIKTHVLLEQTGDLEAMDAEMRSTITPALLGEVLARVPDELLLDAVNGREFASGDEARGRYREYLTTRLEASAAFVAAAVEARDALAREPRQRLRARR